MVKRASIESIQKTQMQTTEHALSGYDYLRKNSSRKNTSPRNKTCDNPTCSFCGEEIAYGENSKHYFCCLVDADPNCDHELDEWCYSGIKCKKCNGWYCL